MNFLKTILERHKKAEKEGEFMKHQDCLDSTIRLGLEYQIMRNFNPGVNQHDLHILELVMGQDLTPELQDNIVNQAMVKASPDEQNRLRKEFRKTARDAEKQGDLKIHSVEFMNNTDTVVDGSSDSDFEPP